MTKATGTSPLAVEPGTRLAALDGVRGIAIAIVMLFHFRSKAWVPGGFLAVDLFFVLSGFLITALLVSEYRRSGSIDLPAFYLRRALRLLPAYSVLWAVYLLTVQVLPHSVSRAPSWGEILASLALCIVYGFNWKLAHARQSPPDIAHFWSLCIEEQYYLIWPLMLIVGHRVLAPRKAILACATLALGACLLPALMHHTYGFGWRRLYYGTDTHIYGLLVGSACGSLHAAGLIPSCWLQRPLCKVALAAVLVWVAILIVRVAPGSAEFASREMPLASLGFGALVSAAATARSGYVHAALASRPIVFLGRRSYALYLWHLPVAHWLRDIEPLPHVVLCSLVSLGLAEVSWRVVEEPALRFKPHRARSCA